MWLDLHAGWLNKTIPVSPNNNKCIRPWFSLPTSLSAYPESGHSVIYGDFVVSYMGVSVECPRGRFGLSPERPLVLIIASCWADGCQSLLEISWLTVPYGISFPSKKPDATSKWTFLISQTEEGGFFSQAKFVDCLKFSGSNLTNKLPLTRLILHGNPFGD